MPTDLSRSIFKLMSLKPDENECRHHRTVSLMKLISELAIRILINTTSTRIKPILEQEN